MINSIKDQIFDYKIAHKLKNILLKLANNPKVDLGPNKERTHRNYRIISKSPIIITASEPVRDIELFSEIIGEDKKAYFLLFFWWTLYDNPLGFKEVVENYKKQIIKYPNHKIILLLNTFEDFQYFKKRDIPCYYINHNCLIDKDSFYPMPIRKEYDVIYNARLEPMKRHYLLNQINNIALISALVHCIDVSKINYLAFLKHLLPQAQILNFSPPVTLKDFNIEHSIPQLSSMQVCEYTNKARVAVILSAKEGACYSSMEYLLCGIPVVSTKSLGGRDVFFDPRFCRIVKSRPASIKKAVDELISMNISPEFIRNETIKKMQPQINLFKKIISTCHSEVGALVDIDDEWKNIYVNKMIDYAHLFPQEFEQEFR